ncbi:hypothetical protein HMF3257_24675 [Spirosoma telluris]|uniref:Uncharacterized protein n=1 Tax=Spirosoma telluris TaxID=2183553 RepID=A0A327NMI9_9BACT|nr:hypothetical protein HMF3257_24675 [Spirosoma telluris]
MAASVLSNFTIIIQKKYVTYLLYLIPVFIFYSLFFYFLTNTPYIDDFSWYFNFINRFTEAHNFTDKLSVFLEPYNNHRIYVQRILIIAYFYLTGHINIAFFILVGNIFFISFLGTIVRKTNLIGGQYSFG